MTCLDELKNALLAVSPHVYHFHAHKPPRRYIVWGEDGPGARRRYYAITDEGRRRLEENKREWEGTRALLDALIFFEEE